MPLFPDHFMTRRRRRASVSAVIRFCGRGGGCRPPRPDHISYLSSFTPRRGAVPPFFLALNRHSWQPSSSSSYLPHPAPHTTHRPVLFRSRPLCGLRRRCTSAGAGKHTAQRQLLIILRTPPPLHTATQYLSRHTHRDTNSRPPTPFTSSVAPPTHINHRPPLILPLSQLPCPCLPAVVRRQDGATHCARSSFYSAARNTV